jgi:hypothetical protein
VAEQGRHAPMRFAQRVGHIQTPRRPSGLWA